MTFKITLKRTLQTVALSGLCLSLPQLTSATTIQQQLQKSQL